MLAKVDKKGIVVLFVFLALFFIIFISSSFTTFAQLTPEEVCSQIPEEWFSQIIERPPQICVADQIINRGKNWNEISNQDCSITRSYYSNSINYLNNSGYESINSTVVPVSVSFGIHDYDYGVERGSYKAYFKESSTPLTPGSRPAAIVKDDYILMFTPNTASDRYINFDKDCVGSNFGKRIAAKQASTLLFEDNVATYPTQWINYQDGGNHFADLVYQYLGDQLKEEVVIADRTFLQERYDNCYDGPLDEEIDMEITFDTQAFYQEDVGSNSLGISIGKLTKTPFKEFRTFEDKDLSTTDEILFIDSNNNTVYYIPELFGYDAIGNQIKLNKTLSMLAGGSLRTIIKVPYSWLNDTNTIYPIKIDPTVLFNTSDGVTDVQTKDNYAFQRYQSYIQFNTGTPLPAAAVITYANISLYRYYTSDNAGNGYINFYHLASQAVDIDNDAAALLYSYTKTVETPNYFDPDDENIYLHFNVTDIYKAHHASQVSYLSMNFLDPDLPPVSGYSKESTTGVLRIGDSVNWASVFMDSQTGFLPYHPYLTVTYALATNMIINETNINTTQLEPNNGVTINFSVYPEDHTLIGGQINIVYPKDNTAGSETASLITVDECTTNPNNGTCADCDIDNQCADCSGCGLTYINTSFYKGNSSTTLVNGNTVPLVFTTTLPDTDYSVMVQPYTDASDHLYAPSYTTKTTTGYDIIVEDDGGSDDGDATMSFAIPTGEYIVGGSKYIKCGLISTSTIGDTIDFTTPFPNSTYSVVATPAHDSDASIVSITLSKNATSFITYVNDDYGNNEPIDEYSWCAFTLGEYTTNTLEIKAGLEVAPGAAWSHSFTTNFTDTNYVVKITHQDTDSAATAYDACACEVTIDNSGKFTANCEDDADSTATCDDADDTYSWVAIAGGESNISTVSCGGTPACDNSTEDACDDCGVCVWGNELDNKFEKDFYSTQQGGQYNISYIYVLDLYGFSNTSYFDDFNFNVTDYTPYYSAVAPANNTNLAPTINVLLNVTLTDLNTADPLDIIFYNASDNSIICSNTSDIYGDSDFIRHYSGDTIRCLWGGLDNSVSNLWYFNITDQVTTNMSGTYNFSIANSPPEYSDIVPTNNTKVSNDITGVSISLNATVTDDNSDILEVSFINASDNSIICTNTSISSGTTVRCLWEGLTSGEDDQWYINVSDSEDIINSGIYNITVNSLPVASNINITPDTAYTTTTLTCDWTYADAENDNQASSIVRWYVDGSLTSTDYYSSGSFPTLGESNFVKDNNVSCVVTPYDNINYGAIVNTSMLISNTAPILASFDPANNTEDIWYSNYILNITYTDTDSDTGTISFVNATSGAIFCTNTSVATSTTVSCGVSSSPSTDILWYANVTDGEDIVTYGTYNASMNTFPTATNINITPDTAYTISTLTCDWTYADGDSDSQTNSYVDWYVEGSHVEQDTYTSGAYPTLTSGNFAKNNNVSCVVTPRDGKNNGTITNTSMLILNTAPVPSSFVPVNTTNSDCTQEQANISGSCGGLDGGDYSCSGSATCSLFYNDAWSSGSFGNIDAYATYQKPTNSHSAVFYWAYTFPAKQTVIIPDSCWSANTSYVNIYAKTVTDTSATIYCQNNTGWQQIDYVGGTDSLMEESIKWNITKIYSGDVTLNTTYTDIDSDSGSMSFVNSTDDSIFCTNTSISTGTKVGCLISPSAGLDVDWYVNVSDGSTVTYLGTNNFTMNSIPVLSNINITPDTSYTNSTLTCDWTYADADGYTDGQVQADWYVAGSLVQSTNYTGGTYPILASSNFAKTQNVSCVIKGYDGIAYSNILNTSMLITNLDPILSSFVPANDTADIYYSNYVLNVTYTDTDSDAGTISFVNASDGSIFCTNTSVSTGTTVGCAISNSLGGYFNWYANVTDGTSTVNYTTYNFSMNIPALATNINITPDTAYTTSTLTCDWTYSDGNSEAEASTYVDWYVAGSFVEQDTYTSGVYPTLTSGNFAKNNNVSCVVTPNDGVQNGTLINTSILISNLDPIQTGHEPANNTGDIYFSSYILNVTYSDTDSDLGTVYFINSSDGSIFCTNTSISSGSTVRCSINDAIGGYFNWYVNVTDGPTTISSGVYNFSMNYLPVVTNINITPDTAYTNTSSLVCDWTYTDTNSESQTDTKVDWYVEGAFITTEYYSSGDYPTLSSGNYAKGENVTCVVTPNDNIQYGTPVNTSMLISNLEPWLQGFIPTNNTQATIWTGNYVINVTYNDTDSDTGTVSFINTTSGAIFCTNTSISAGTVVSCGVATTIGTDFQWYANVSDGTDIVTYNTYNISMNTAPSVSNVNITPDTAYTNSTLTCDWTFTDADGHVQNDTTIKWYVDGVNVETDTWDGTNWPTLTSGNFEKAENVSCVVNVTDGGNYADTLGNTSQIIQNLVPTFTSVTVGVSGDTPPAQKTDILTCTANSVADGDGDGTTNYYQYLDTDNATVLQSWSTTSTFDCSGDADCTKADYILCQIKIGDGTVNSSTKESYISVVNTIPIASDVAVIPVSPDASEDLNCTYSYSDADSDAESDVYYRWYNSSNLMPITIFQVGGGNTSANELWKCEVTVWDGEANSTSINSSAVNVSSSSPTISVITTETEVDAGKTIQFNWTWSDPELPAGTYTHYVCNSSSINTSGCGDAQLCNSTVLTSPANCTYTTQQTDDHSYTAYFMIHDELNQSSSIESKGFLVNHNITASNTTINVTTTGLINTYTCGLNGANDSDGDTIQYKYTFDYGGSVLQAESATSTFIVSSGVGTHGENITCSARGYDSRTYSIKYNASNHLRNQIPTYSTNKYVNTAINISYLVNNVSAIDKSFITIRDPFSSQTVNETNYVSAIGKYNFSISTALTGAWTIKFIVTNTTDGQSYMFRGSADQFTVTTVPDDEEEGGGGGGGGGPTPRVIPISTTNITGYCGDNICQANENPASCWQDCKVNYDTLISCVWDPDVECNWSQNWFPVFLVGLLIIVGILSVYQYEVRQKKEKK